MFSEYWVQASLFSLNTTYKSLLATNYPKATNYPNRSAYIEFYSDDVIKIKFVKLWNWLKYFERTTSERPTN